MVSPECPNCGEELGEKKKRLLGQQLENGGRLQRTGH
jgi:hypothetical protein